MQTVRLARLLLLCVLPMLANSLLAQNPSSQPANTPTQADGQPSQAAPPSFKSSSNLVLVDVVVTRNGGPVKGLRQSAFRVYEAGREQTIKVFEEHTAAEGASLKRASLPPETYSNSPESTAASANILLLDALNTPLENQLYVRRQMIAYLKKVPPGTRIAIFTLASRLRFVQGLTSDISSVLAALNSSKNGASQSILLEDTDNLISSGFDSRLDPSTAASSLLQFQADVTAVQTDMRVQITLDALKQLAHSLDGFPGRKNLIWVSGSFPVDLGPDPASSNPFFAQRDYRQQLQEVDDLLAAGRIAVYPVDARGLLPNSSFAANPVNAPLSDALAVDHSNMGSMGHLPSASGAVGAYGASIPSGSTGQFARQVTAEHGTMRQVAEQSGGVAFYESNGFNKALASALEDSASYYTLAYSPENKQLDGRFRKIEVKLLDSNNKKDATTEKYILSYRRGYFADPPQTKPTQATAWAAGTSMVHNAPSSARLFFRAKVTRASEGASQDAQPNEASAGSLTQKLQGPRQRYSIDFLADMHRVNASVAEDGFHYSTLEFIAIAYDENGKILNYSDRSFKRKMDSAKYGEALQNGWPMHQDLDVPAGDVYLRLGVRDTSTGWLGSLEIPIKATSAKNDVP